MTIRYLFLLFKFFWDIIFCSTATIQINALHNDDDSGVAFYGHPKRTCKQAQQIVNFFYHNVVRFSYVHKTFGLCCKFYQVISTRIILEENKEIILVQIRAGSEDRNESTKIAFFQSTEIMQCGHTGWQLAPGLVSHHCRGDTWSRGKLGKG